MDGSFPRSKPTRVLNMYIRGSTREGSGFWTFGRGQGGSSPPPPYAHVWLPVKQQTDVRRPFRERPQLTDRKGTPRPNQRWVPV